MEMFGIRLVGVNAETGHKLPLTVAVVIAILLLRAATVGLVRVATGRYRNEWTMFWTRQAASIAAALLSTLHCCRSGSTTRGG